MGDQVLVHHGVDGQEWRKRKYQYEDGSLTPLGRIHYGVGEARDRAKIKMREEKAKAKNEIRIAKAKAKAEATKVKAEAKAYKMRKQADTQAERDKIQAEKEIESKRIDAEREAEANVSKENREIAKADAKTQVQLAEMANEGKKEESLSKVAKVALGVMAAAGVGYLLYKAVKGGGVEGVSEAAKSKAQDVVESMKDTKASEITSKVQETAAKTEEVKTKVDEARSKTDDYIKKLSGIAKGGGETADERKSRGDKEAALRDVINQRRNEASNSKELKDAFRSMFTSSNSNNQSSQSSGSHLKVPTEKQTKHKATYETGLAKTFRAASDKIANSKRKEKYYYDQAGNYVRATRQADGTYTEKLARADSYSNKRKERILQRAYKTYTKHSDTEGKILVHSSLHEGMVICHYGKKGMKWGVINEKMEDTRTKGRTQNVSGETEGAKKTGEGLGSGARINNYKPSNGTKEYKVVEDNPYKQWYGSYAPRTKKEYTQFVETDVKNLLNDINKQDPKYVLQKFEDMIKTYSEPKAYKLESGEIITSDEVLKIVKEGYDKFMPAYQEAKRAENEEAKKKAAREKARRNKSDMKAKKEAERKEKQFYVGNSERVAKLKYMGWFSKDHVEPKAGKEIKRKHTVKHSEICIHRNKKRG